MKSIKIVLTLILTFGIMSSCNSTNNCSPNGKENCIDTTAIVLNNIMTRTSIRQFTDRQISKDTLDKIVKAGMAAPSAVNAQPWAFVVVTEKAVLDSLNANHPYANLKTATAAIIVCGDLTKAREKNVPDYWVQDCSAATENILLAAHGYGLGAVWCGVYPNAERLPAVKKILELPENITPLNIITMGFPAENPTPKDKFKEENVHYQKW